MSRSEAMDVSSVPTPAYLCDIRKLRKNLRILADLQDDAACKILLALKAFAMWSVFPIIKPHLSGVSASSLSEARLGREEFGGEVHVCAPAYREEEFSAIAEIADKIVFNSVTQWKRHRSTCEAAGKDVECGIRINPQHSEVKTPLYDPCGRGSRLGTVADDLCNESLDGISGLHFHTLCELGADALDRTATVVEERFGKYLERMSWINFGGGHHITRPGYDLDRLIEICQRFQNRYGLRIYLEPGEAVALNCGYLVCSVLDVMKNGIDIAILDTSATAHMPDVLEMPYKPEILGAAQAGIHPYTYRLGGITCLAGDVIGDYSFQEPLRIGQKLVFTDMAHYTMVKNTTFNGVQLPSIGTIDDDGAIRIVRQFGYEDYKQRLS